MYTHPMQGDHDMCDRACKGLGAQQQAQAPFQAPPEPGVEVLCRQVGVELLVTTCVEVHRS